MWGSLPFTQRSLYCGSSVFAWKIQCSYSYRLYYSGDSWIAPTYYLLLLTSIYRPCKWTQTFLRNYARPVQGRVATDRLSGGLFLVWMHKRCWYSEMLRFRAIRELLLQSHTNIPITFNASHQQTIIYKKIEGCLTTWWDSPFLFDVFRRFVPPHFVQGGFL